MLELRVRKRLVLWLITGALMVYIMVMIGGITRLTGSGLSITEWDPIMGVIPPLDEADWEIVYHKYMASPEGTLVNSSMTIDEFKYIYFWEWFHRIWGRLIGLVFLIPCLIFWSKKQIRGNMKGRVLVLFALGGLQGLMGWLMVASGLVKEPHVSHIRLMMHLMLALLIMGYIIWLITQLTYQNVRPDLYGQKTKTRKLLRVFMVVLIVQIIYGAFMAGLKAGLTYPTYPLMAGQLVPDGMFMQSPWVSNFTNNVTFVQFIHRMLPWALIVIAVMYFVRFRKYHARHARAAKLTYLMFITLGAQIILGILTLVNCQGKVPVGYGVAHQAIGVVLFAVSLFLFYAFGKRKS